MEDKDAITDQLTSPEKPILKRDRPQRREEERENSKPRGNKGTADQAPQKQGRSTPSPVKPEHRGSKSAPTHSTEVQRPSRPTRSTEPVAAMPVATPPKPVSGGAKKEILLDEHRLCWI